MRKIVYYPNPILRVKTEIINDVDKELESDVKDLVVVLGNEKNHAAGLAAVQIGLDRRFFGLIMGKERKLKVFINPLIVATYGEKTRPIMTFEDNKQEDFLEGCLSFPGLFGTVKRYLKIEAQWQELSNQKLVTSNKILEGIEAIAYQHELDHLNGILFIDHINEEKGELYSWEGEKKMRIEVEMVVEQEK